MKLILHITLYTLFVFTAYGQSVIHIDTFVYNGKKEELEDNFEVFFVTIDSTKKTIVKPIIFHNTFTVPNNLDKRGHIVFKYKNKVFGFGENPFDYRQNIRWQIGYNRKYVRQYTEERDINSKKIKGVSYIEFHPLEYGEGTVTTIFIVNAREYFKSSRELIQ